MLIDKCHGFFNDMLDFVIVSRAYSEFSETYEMEITA